MSRKQKPVKRMSKSLIRFGAALSCSLILHLFLYALQQLTRPSLSDIFLALMPGIYYLPAPQDDFSSTPPYLWLGIALNLLLYGILIYGVLWGIQKRKEEFDENTKPILKLR